MIAAVILGVPAALRRRLKEIEGGEEEGAAEVIAYGTTVKII